MHEASLWLGTPRGLYRYRIRDKVWSAYGKHNGLLSNVITSLELNDDVLWIGQDAGVTAFNLRSNSILHHTIATGLPPERVWSIAFENDFVWAGGVGDVGRYDDLIEQWQRLDNKSGLRGSRVFAIVPQKHLVTLVTDSTVCEYDSRHERWRYFDPPGEGRIEDAFSTTSWLWLFRGTDLLRYDAASRNYALYPIDELLADGPIKYIRIDGNIFLIFTASSVWRYDMESDALRPFQEIDGLPDPNIYCSASSDAGRVLLFNTASGISMYDTRTRHWTYLTQAGGMPESIFLALFSFGNGFAGITESNIHTWHGDEARWYSFPLLDDIDVPSAHWSLDPAEGSYADIAGMRLDFSGSRSAWLFEDPLGIETTGHGKTISSRNDLKARLELGGDRRIMVMYNDGDYEDVTYGAEYRGSRTDVLQSIQVGDVRLDAAGSLLSRSMGLYGVGARMVYGIRSPRYGRSPVEVHAITGHKTTAVATDVFDGRTTAHEISLPDTAWTRRVYFHLRPDTLLLPFTADGIDVYRSAMAHDAEGRIIHDQSIAGHRGDWVRMREILDYTILDHESVVQFTEHVHYPKLAVRIRRASNTEEFLLVEDYETRFEIVNRYRFGPGTDIIPSTFSLRIVDDMEREFPLSQFGLDSDNDYRVDAEFVNYRVGELRFPQRYPFHASAYGPFPVSTYSMHIRFETFRASYRLSKRRIIRGSERVTVDGMLVRPGEDYILDYSLGYLRFTRDGAVHDDSRIEITYEYVRSVPGERVMQATLTISPSDYTQAVLSTGVFDEEEAQSSTRFIHTRGEIRGQWDGLDVRVLPEYQRTWSERESGDAAAIVAAISTERLRLSTRSRMTSPGFAETTKRTFVHGRLRDEHDVHGEYDITNELRSFASWTRRDGEHGDVDWMVTEAISSVGMQWVKQEHPSITLRLERVEDNVPSGHRHLDAARMDASWTPSQALLSLMGISSARLTSQARLAYERSDLSNRPGEFRLRNHFLRTVVSLRPLFSINALFQTDASDRRTSGNFIKDRHLDKVSVEALMEHIRGLSLGVGYTRDHNRFYSNTDIFDSDARSASQVSLRLTPGVWVGSLSRWTLYLTVSRNRMEYRRLSTYAGWLPVFTRPVDGVPHSRVAADALDTRVEWRPSSTLRNTVTARIDENRQTVSGTSITQIERALGNRIDYQPNNRSLQAVEVLATWKHGAFARSENLTAYVWTEQRLSDVVLLRGSVEPSRFEQFHYGVTSLVSTIRMSMLSTFTFERLPIIRRLEVRNNTAYTLSEHVLEESKPYTSWSTATLTNSLYLDIIPHPVLYIRFRLNVSRHRREHAIPNAMNWYDIWEPDAQLQVIMQL